MSKATPKDIKEQQFVAEHFGDITNFDAFLQGVIDSQEKLLSGRIGASVFGSTDQIIIDQLKAASINLVSSDLIQRRIIRASGNITVETSSIIDSLSKIKKGYDEAASTAINRITTAGSAADSGGYSGGTVVSEPAGWTEF